jgi:hypothetical protein
MGGEVNGETNRRRVYLCECYVAIHNRLIGAHHICPTSSTTMAADFWSSSHWSVPLHPLKIVTG